MYKKFFLKILLWVCGLITILTLSNEFILQSSVFRLVNLPGSILYFSITGDIHFSNSGAFTSILLTIFGSTIIYTFILYYILKPRN